ncbi:MAG: hypothetical protein KDK36_07750, partial [Leptospiraceae bacterium]|nr:hypothetical protein [Leptospiraceae bacterium]
MQFKEKAVFFHPDKYSKSEWEKANSLIKDLQAKQKENSNISKEEFSKLISGARASLETCMKNSFEPAWKELSNSAEEGIKEAETAFAESLSSRNYDKSRELL